MQEGVTAPAPVQEGFLHHRPYCTGRHLHEVTMPRLKQVSLLRTPLQMDRVQSIEAGSTTPTWGAGRGGRPWRRLRRAILLRDEYTCKCCGRVDTEAEVDHIDGVNAGDAPSNLQTLCKECHRVKTEQEARDAAAARRA